MAPNLLPLRLAMRTLIPSLLTLLLALPAAAEGRCRKVKGKFASAPAPTCSSPVGLCTLGTLEGSLRAGYAFTMNQILDPGEPSLKAVSFFTGISTISFSKGSTLTGTDAGAIDLMPYGDGPFSTLISITGGEGAYAGSSGWLQVRGRLDFATGRAAGKYSGVICKE